MSDKSLREKIDWLVKQVKCLGSQIGVPEIDPVFIASPAGTIEQTDIDSWNNKLDAETDTLQSVATRGNTTNLPIIVNTDILISKGLNNQLTNIGIGKDTLKSTTTGVSNTVLGYISGDAITSGESNTLIGTETGTNITTGSFNVGVGQNSLQNNLIGNQNVALGNNAGQQLTGNRNTIIGSFESLQTPTIIGGANNIAIGYNVPLSGTNVSNELNIGNWIYGRNGNIAIGTNLIPTEKLDVNGKVKSSEGFITNATKPIGINANNNITYGESNITTTQRVEGTFHIDVNKGQYGGRVFRVQNNGVDIFILPANVGNTGNSPRFPFINNANGDAMYTKQVVAKVDGTFGIIDKNEIVTKAFIVLNEVSARSRISIFSIKRIIRTSAKCTHAIPIHCLDIFSLWRRINVCAREKCNRIFFHSVNIRIHKSTKGIRGFYVLYVLLKAELIMAIGDLIFTLIDSVTILFMRRPQRLFTKRYLFITYEIYQGVQGGSGVNIASSKEEIDPL